MRDRERRAARASAARAPPAPAARGGVERRGRLVQDQDARVLQDHARDRQALLLAARQPVAALARPSCRSRRAARRSGRGCTRPAPRPRAPPAVASGLPYSRLRRTVVWNRYVSCVTTPIASPSDSSVISRTSMPSISTAPSCHVVEARHEVGDGGLAGAARTDERRELPGLDLEVDVVERPRPRAPSRSAVERRRLVRRRDRRLVRWRRVVAEAHVPQRDLPARPASGRATRVRARP